MGEGAPVGKQEEWEEADAGRERGWDEEVCWGCEMKRECLEVCRGAVVPKAHEDIDAVAGCVEWKFSFITPVGRQSRRYDYET